MPRARTTSQGSGLLAAVGRTAVAAVLAGLLAGLVAPASAHGAGAGDPTTAQPASSDRTSTAGSPEPSTVQRGSAEGTSTAGSPEPSTVQRGSAEGTSTAGSPEPPRLDGAVTPRRYGLPTALAVVLLLGVASLQLRLLLAEPAARPADPSAAPRLDAERRPGVGSPRW